VLEKLKKKYQQLQLHGKHITLGSMQLTLMCR